MTRKTFLLFLIIILILCGCAKKESISYEYHDREVYVFEEFDYLGIHLNLEYNIAGSEKVYLVEDTKELALLVYYNYLNNNTRTTYIMKNNKSVIWDHLYLYIYALIPDIISISDVDATSLNGRVIFLYFFTERDTNELKTVSEEIIEGIPKDSSERAKVKYIHDYLVKNAQYDMYAYNHLDDYDIYSYASDAYAIIVNKKGMCAGYSNAMNYLLNEIGIPSLVVSSDAENHAWNLIYIENQWYQLDATWDDPIPDVRGRIFYTYFLKPASNGRFADHKYDKFTNTTFDLETYLEFGNWLLGIE